MSSHFHSIRNHHAGCCNSFRICEQQDFQINDCVCLFVFFNDNLKDNQPPEVRGCSEDIDIKSSEDITFFNWTAPSFYDPAGKPITVSTNYPTNNFNFSWGDFKVQYVALKPSNGLRKECVFNLKIRRKFIPSQNIHAKLPLIINKK